jgi:hypothetical protein
LGVCLQRSLGHLRYQSFALLAQPDGTNAGRPLTCRDITEETCAHSEDLLHFLRAVELASALMKATVAENRTRYPEFSFLGVPQEYEREPGGRNSFRRQIGPRNGIVFVENFWVDDRGQNASHIDLWSGALARTKNELFYRGRTTSPDLRFDEVADRVIFWEIAG